ncbi:MAG TPA: non-heme iron oxygenase ferredoxin subunit [Gammaproteobacteria bacterium]
MSDWVDVAAEGEISPGTFRCVEVDDVIIAVFNLDGEFYAIENVCSHEYAELTDGDLEGNEIVCPLHGARFDIKSGEALSPPAYEPVATLPVRVEAGMVQVRDHRWD